MKYETGAKNKTEETDSFLDGINGKTFKQEEAEHRAAMKEILGDDYKSPNEELEDYLKGIDANE